MSTVPQRLGKYELRQRLGSGNLGEVWKSYDLQLQREVALKIIHTDLQADPDFFTHFMKEGQLIASLHHTNIVQVHDVTIFRPPQGNTSTAYIVMEYIEGRDLTDYMQHTSRNGQFPSLTDIVYLFTSLGVAIDYAHQKGIVHGDLKPSNILFDRRLTSHFEIGEPMLTDFGLSNLLSGMGNVASPAYMSPEQAMGQIATYRSDVYSLGVILYELCTGVQPFRDESSVAVMMQHINTLPVPPILINANIPPALSEVILRAMAKDESTRFPMASLLAAAVADACSLRAPAVLSQRQPFLREQREEYLRATGGIQPTVLGVSQPLPAQPADGLKTVPTSSPMADGMNVVPTSSPPAASAAHTRPITTPQPAVSNPSQTGKQKSVEPQPLILQPAPKSTAMNGFTKDTSAVPHEELVEQPTRPSSAKMRTVRLPQEEETTRKIAASSGRSPLPIPISSPPSSAPPVAAAGSLPRERRSSNGVPLFVVAVASALLLLVIGGAIGVSLLNARNAASAGGMSGHVFFQDDALGHEDVLRIEMSNVSDPEQGKTYVAWLRDGAGHTSALGRLPVHDGTISYTYNGNAQHTNLLSLVQSVLITQEDEAAVPQTPKGKTNFQAGFDPTTFPAIKNILYSTPNFPSNESVVAGMLETIKSMNDKAGSIVDTLQDQPHDHGLARRQAVRIIEMVDGTQYAVSSGDQPSQYANELEARAGLLSSPTQPGYIDTLSTQLDQLQAAAGNNATLLAHIQHVRNAINDLKDWVQKIRSLDVQLLKAADLTNPAIIGVALQLKKAAADSYTGRTIPPNEGPLPTPGSAGAYQAYVEAQYMASLDLKRVS